MRTKVNFGRNLDEQGFKAFSDMPLGTFFYFTYNDIKIPRALCIKSGDLDYLHLAGLRFFKSRVTNIKREVEPIKEVEITVVR